MPRQVLDSDAFNELSKSAKLTLILSLDQLDYWVKKKHKGERYRESSVGRLRNDGCFSLPNNLLKERGITSSTTIASVRRELVGAGSWETVQTGPLQQTGIFRWSDEWLVYENRPLKSRKAMDASAQQPGYCHYPNIIKYNEARQAGATAHQCSGSPSALPSEALAPEDLPLQLVLFDELVDDGDTEDYCRAVEAV